MARSERVLTYEDVRRTPEDGKRYELLEGQLVVTASPNTRHQGIVVRLLSMLLWPAEQHGYGCAFGAPVDVVLHETEAVVVPDLVFIAKDRLGIITEPAVRGAPDLVVEILSPSTGGRDLGVKLRLYAKHGVRWYWVIDPERQVIRVFEWRDGAYIEQAPRRPGDTLTSPLFPDVSAALTEVLEGVIP
jgi:Uma2 family endonuclease